MTDIFYSSHRRHPYSDSQTGGLSGVNFSAARVGEVASEHLNFPDGRLSSGGRIHVIGEHRYEMSDVYGAAVSDGKRPYPPMLRMMVRIGAVMIVVGLVIGFVAPGPITGAILPIGLVLFAIAGWLARRQDIIGSSQHPLLLTG